ncbi:MAG: hypothetical protein II823_03570 [Kiritimatiellae bacterium]|nr:hypothetical protein [Kiritimatiellia bacterium]
MDQTNAIVDCDVARLDAPLRPFKARAGHNFVALFRRVPADVTGLFVRIFRANDSYFDVTAHEHTDGGWTVRIPAACFPETGEFKYEVHATAADDQPAAIGEGRLVVAPFSTTTTPLAIGAVQEVAQLPCAGGGFVQVLMKWDGYEWMPEAVHSATANEGTEES